MVSPEIIERVLSQAQSSASHSWEYGIVYEALLEYHNPSLSVFNDPFPDGKLPVVDKGKVPALNYVEPVILTDGHQLCEGNGSSADCLSLLPAALLLNSRNPCIHSSLTHMLTRIPRLPSGAISHRDAYPSLWADSLTMIPPSLAYFSIYSHDITYLREAVRQCEAYYEGLVDRGSGCLRHIYNVEEGEGRKKDDGLWSTGNAWAVWGMCRVVAILTKSPFAHDMQKETSILIRHIHGIALGIMNLDTHPSGLVRNRLNDESWFGEVAGTALVAAAVLRAAVLAPDVFEGIYTDWAVRKMEVVETCIDHDTGIVAPVVNPTSDEQREPLDGVSAEAQAFVVLGIVACEQWMRWKNAQDDL